MDFPKKLIIPSKDINDPDWQDITIRGWLSFFIFCNIFSIILGMGSIYHLFHVPSVIRWLLASAYLVPLYSCAALLIRSRDAVFITLCSLGLTLLMNIGTCGLGILFALPLDTYLPSLIYIVSGLIWIGYFIRSKQVEARWPVTERKIFIFDYFLVAFGIVIDLIYFFNLC